MYCVKGITNKPQPSVITIVYYYLYLQSYHGYLYLRQYVHHDNMYLDSPGHRLESPTKKNEKRIKDESPSVLPDSEQGPPESLNPMPHSLGLGLGPLPYLCCSLLHKPPWSVNPRDWDTTETCTWILRDTICPNLRGTTV